jgi:hypothetical protein
VLFLRSPPSKPSKMCTFLAFRSNVLSHGSKQGA